MEAGVGELEGEKAELVHVDEAALGHCGAGAVPRQRDHGGERRPNEAAVVGVRQVVDWDAGWAGGHLYFWGVRQAATDNELSYLVGVARRVVPLVPSFLRDVGRGEPVCHQRVDAQAAVVFDGPGPEILGELQDAVQVGAVLTLLAEKGVR